MTAFEAAAACHRAAGRQDEAARDVEAADRFRPVVERDYLAHRVRLEHALEAEDLPAALAEARTLRSLTTGSKSSYTEWLAMVERRLELIRHEPKKKETP